MPEPSACGITPSSPTLAPGEGTGSALPVPAAPNENSRVGIRRRDPIEDIIDDVKAGTDPQAGGEWDQVVDPETWVAPQEFKAEDNPLRVVRRPPEQLVRTRAGG